MLSRLNQVNFNKIYFYSVHRVAVVILFFIYFYFQNLLQEKKSFSKFLLFFSVFVYFFYINSNIILIQVDLPSVIFHIFKSNNKYYRIAIWCANGVHHLHNQRLTIQPSYIYHETFKSLIRTYVFITKKKENNNIIIYIYIYFQSRMSKQYWILILIMLYVILA